MAEGILYLHCCRNLFSGASDHGSASMEKEEQEKRQKEKKERIEKGMENSVFMLFESERDYNV